MKNVLRVVVAVVAGCLIGGAVNMGIIVLGSSLIPPPPGADVTSMESLKATMHLFGPMNFIPPFLAHALGTLAGALTASLIAAKHNLKLALGIGVFFMLGGLVNVFLLPAPAWFAVLDLTAAYLPMGWLGWRISGKDK